MIETFKPGTLLRFTDPRAQGTDSGDRAGFKTVPATAITLKYLAQGSEDWDKASTASIQWLPWIPAFVSETALGALDVLSGPFTGCWMVAYRDQDGTTTYAGHIGTDLSDSHPSSLAAKQAWQTFASGNEDSLITGFNAGRDYKGGYPGIDNSKENGTLFGLMTPGPACYVLALAKGLSTGGDPIYRVLEILPSLGKSPGALKDIFSVAQGLTFTLEDWKAGTSGGAFHTRSTDLKNLDRALGGYLDNPSEGTKTTLKWAFFDWRKRNPKEYNSPARTKRNYIKELEDFLGV